MDCPPPAPPRPAAPRPRLPAPLRRPLAVDHGLTAALAGLTLVLDWTLIAKFGDSSKLAYAAGSVAAWHRLLISWCAASAVGLGALPLRRRFPLAVFGVTLAMAAVHAADPVFGLSPADLAVPIALYSLAAARPRRVSLGALAGGIALAVAAAAVAGGSLGSGWLVQPSYIGTACLALAVAWFAGNGSRTHREYLAEVQRRASDAERDRDRQAQLAAAAERARITGELHDVVAHALSVMVIQAQGAGSALRREHPAEAGQALEAIVTTGRGALAEIRRLLGVVRQQPASPAGEQPALAPQPSLAGLEQLIEQVRRAGTPVELRVDGTPRALAAVLELTGFRIIQECLTNTITHAGPAATATVRVCYGPADLIVEVTDDGPAIADGSAPASHPPAGHGGHGLIGMRARAAMLGGDVSAGPAAAGGFRVRVRLPLTTSAAARPASTGPGG